MVLVLLLDSVINITYFCNIGAIGSADFAELSSIINGVVTVDTTIIEFTNIVVFIISVRTFLTFFLA